MTITRWALVGAVSMALGAVGARAEDIKIDSKDAEWHIVSRNLVTNQCYELRFVSTVRYSPTVPKPDNLHVLVRGATKQNVKATNKGGESVTKTITFTAQKTELAVKLNDLNYADNSGSLGVTLAPCKQ